MTQLPIPPEKTQPPAPVDSPRFRHSIRTGSAAEQRRAAQGIGAVHGQTAARGTSQSSAGTTCAGQSVSPRHHRLWQPFWRLVLIRRSQRQGKNWIRCWPWRP